MSAGPSTGRTHAGTSPSKLSACARAPHAAGRRRLPNAVRAVAKIADLKERLRLYDHRSTELEEAERELADEQSKLRREKESHLAHVQKVQTEMGEHLKEVDEQIRQMATQQRYQREEERLAEAVRGLPRPEARGLQDEADRETLIDQVRQISQERDKALAELKAQKRTGRAAGAAAQRRPR